MWRRGDFHAFSIIMRVNETVINACSAVIFIIIASSNLTALPLIGIGDKLRAPGLRWVENTRRREGELGY